MEHDLREAILEALAAERTAVLTHIEGERGKVFQQIAMERNEVLLELNNADGDRAAHDRVKSGNGRRYQQALSIHTPDAGRALDPDGHLSDRRDGGIRTTVNRLLDIKERQLGQRP